MFEDEWPVSTPPATPTGQYRSAMTVSAHDVAAAIRNRLPGVPTKKLHKLLYYAQGHHLATFGRPLFGESVMAYDMGPLIAQLWYAEKHDAIPQAPVQLDEAGLNTVGAVLSRYGGLTGADLEALTHAEPPWQLADRGRNRGESQRIEPEWMEDFFASQRAEDDDVPLDSQTVRHWLADAGSRRVLGATTPDSRAELLERLTPRA